MGSTVSVRKQVKLRGGEPHNYAEVGSWYQGTSVTFLLHCSVNTACDFQKLKINLENATPWTVIIFCQLNTHLSPMDFFFLETFASSAVANSTEG